MLRKVLIVLSVLLIFGFVFYDSAESEEENVMITQQQARLDAARDVARDANSASWGIGGFCCGFFAIGASWIHTPTVPAANLIGKSPNYIVFYTQAYQSEMKKRNLYAATTGCVVGVGVSILWLLVSE